MTSFYDIFFFLFLSRNVIKTVVLMTLILREKSFDQQYNFAALWSHEKLFFCGVSTFFLLFEKFLNLISTKNFSTEKAFFRACQSNRTFKIFQSIYSNSLMQKLFRNILLQCFSHPSKLYDIRPNLARCWKLLLWKSLWF